MSDVPEMMMIRDGSRTPLRRRRGTLPPIQARHLWWLVHRGRSYRAPDMSVNRSRYDRPIGSAGGGFDDWGVCAFRARDIPPNCFTLEVRLHLRAAPRTVWYN